MREVWTTAVKTPFGHMRAVATDDALVMLEFEEEGRAKLQTGTLSRYLGGPVHEFSNSVLDLTQEQLDQYFAREREEFTMPLKLYGTPFQIRVWRQLLEIRYGQTSTYSQVAKTIENKEASRAVGKANGDNRLAIVVPCHRVIRADGHMCGYGGGLWRKQYLLALESGQPLLL